MNMTGALSPQKQNMPSGANNGITEGALQNALATYQTPSDEFRSGVQGFLDNRQQAQAQLQARGMQQPTYQVNGVNPAFAAVTDGAMGNIEARNKSMQGLI